MEQSAIRDLVKQFRRGCGMTDTQRKRMSLPFAKFGLSETVRNTQLRFEIPLDMGMFREIHETVRRSLNAGKRLGEDWVPENVRLIERRVDDDRWATRESMRVLDDVCTRFMTKKFFPDAFIRINMTVNMIRMYDKIARDFSVPYKIVFKGGVHMRLVILEFLHDLHVSVRHDAVEYLSQEQHAVGVSDFDFEIVPDHHDQSPSKTYRQVMANSMYLLWLRKYIEEGIILKGHTDSGRYDTSHHLMNTAWDYAESEYELRDMLQSEVYNLPSDHSLSGIRVDHVHIVHPKRRPPQLEHRTRLDRHEPVKRENLYIFKQNINNGLQQEVQVAPASEILRSLGVSEKLNEKLSSSMGALYCTSNFHIGEHEEPTHALSMIGDFHLTRMKHAFFIYYTTKDGHRRVDRLAGEVIDLSQSNYGKNDQRKQHMYHDHPHPWVDYPILEIPGQVIRSYSIPALLHDIQDVLHHSDEIPWLNRKVSKRLVRYCIVLIMVTYTHPIPRSDKNAAIQTLISYVEDPNRMRRAKMRRTKVPHVDEFADHEYMSITTHCTGNSLCRDSKMYYASMCNHLRNLLGFMKRDEVGSMDLAQTLPLNAMFVGHSDQLMTHESHKRIRCDVLLG